MAEKPCKTWFLVGKGWIDLGIMIGSTRRENFVNYSYHFSGGCKIDLLDAHRVMVVVRDKERPPPMLLKSRLCVIA